MGWTVRRRWSKKNHLVANWLFQFWKQSCVFSVVAASRRVPRRLARPGCW